MNRIIFPDKPIRATELVFPHLVNGAWLAQLKMDGWRCMIAWDGVSLTLTSRHQKPIPVSGTMILQLTDWIRDKPPCTLDAEWMGRRDGQSEGLYLFDCLSLDGVWYGSRTVAERWGVLRGLTVLRGHSPFAGIQLVESADANYHSFFNYSKTVPGCEGIVLKKFDSRFIGSTRQCVCNSKWLKIKWRDGEDGQLRIA
jgi:ATP-dependent DNA ligase